jgi:hypothetical protein
MWIILLFAITAAIILMILNYPKPQAEQSVSKPAGSNMPYNSTANIPSSQETSGIIAMASKTDTYILREYEGKIGIFLNDNAEPYQQIDVDVSTFSQEDQRLLKEGIKVYSTEDLNRKIEDYES